MYSQDEPDPWYGAELIEIEIDTNCISAAMGNPIWALLAAGHSPEYIEQALFFLVRKEVSSVGADFHRRQSQPTASAASALPRVARPE